MVQARLIKHRDTQIFLLTIGFGHLQEGIDFADSRDVVRDEGLDLRLQVNLLRLVALNVLKHFLELLRNGQVSILIWVIGTRYFLFIIFIVFIFLLLLLALLHLLLSTLCTCLLLLSVLTSSNVNVHLVFFLVRIDLFRIIDIDSQIEGLVLHFITLNICGGFSRLTAGLGR